MSQPGMESDAGVQEYEELMSSLNVFQSSIGSLSKHVTQSVDRLQSQLVYQSTTTGESVAAESMLSANDNLAFV